MRAIAEAYAQAILDTDRARALEVIEAGLAAGARPEEIIFEVVVPSLDFMVEQLIETGEATLAQHYINARLADEITEAMIARMEHPPTSIGRMVIGTARGDFHGLGRKIVRGCLRAHMIEVIDLGLNVTPERFVEAAQEHGAGVIGVSSMMVHTARGAAGPRGVRALLDGWRLSDQIRLVVGGAPFQFDPQLAEAVGADGWAPDALLSIPLVKGLLKGQP